MSNHRATGLLLCWLFTASAAADEFEFSTPPPDVLFGADTFNLPLPPPVAGGMAMSSAMAMPGMPFNLIMLAEQLDLTAEQRDKAGRIMDETMPKLRALMFRMIDARKAAKDLKSGATSDKELRAHADEQGRIVADLTYLGLKARSDLRAVLTEEQRTKLDAMSGDRGGFFIHRFGKMGGIDPTAMPLPGAVRKELEI